MVRLIYWIGASFLAVVHPVVTLVILLGWAHEDLFCLHGFFVFLTVLSWVFYGHCVLSDWEYKLRKKLDSDIELYEYGYLHYHLRKLTPIAPDKKFIKRIGMPFLVCLLIVWCFNLYLKLL